MTKKKKNDKPGDASNGADQENADVEEDAADSSSEDIEVKAHDYPSSETVNVHAVSESSKKDSNNTGLILGMIIALSIITVGGVIWGTWLMNEINVLDTQVQKSIVSQDNLANEFDDALETQQEAISLLAFDMERVKADLDALFGDTGGEEISTTLPEGALPPLGSSDNDPAVGMDMPAVVGYEYYLEELVEIEPQQGYSAAYLYWAHWCPYCQEELPALADIWGDDGADYPHVNLITVSTGQDTSRGNPEGEYLEEEQFPFTVVIDEEGYNSTMVGLAAFPTWVLVDPNGQVMYRIAGGLGEDSIRAMLEDLEALAVDGAADNG